MSKKTTSVHEDGDLRRYFSMIPHLVDDADLDPYAYRLYGHLKRLARQGNEVEKSTRELAAHCRMSVGKISAAKRDLATAKLITLESDGYRDKITLVDVWRKNMLHYANEGDETRSPREQDASLPRSWSPKSCSPDEQDSETRSPHEQTRSSDEQSRSPDEQDSETRSPHEQTRSPGESHNEYINKNNYKKEEKGSVGVPPTPPPHPDAWDDFLLALCWICHGHKELANLTDAQTGAVTAEAKKLYNNGYTMADLHQWMKEHWFVKICWKNDKERPRPDVVRSSIPILRDKEGDGTSYTSYVVSYQLNGHHTEVDEEPGSPTTPTLASARLKVEREGLVQRLHAPDDVTLAFWESLKTDVRLTMSPDHYRMIADASILCMNQDAITVAIWDREIYRELLHPNRVKPLARGASNLAKRKLTLIFEYWDLEGQVVPPGTRPPTEVDHAKRSEPG